MVDFTRQNFSPSPVPDGAGKFAKLQQPRLYFTLLQPGLSNVLVFTVSTYSVILVTPIASNVFRVFFSREPLHQSVLGPNDSQNRLNWAISVTAGFGTVPVIEQILNPQPQPTAIPTNPTAWSVDLFLDRPILLATTYLVVAQNIVAVDGSVLVVGTTDRGSSAGDQPFQSRLPPKPKSTAQGIDFKYDTIAGIFSLDSKSDIDVQSGIDAVKKRVIRRILSTPGGFYHISDYGLGLRQKEIFKTTQIALLTARAKQQILQEPEIADAKVTAQLTSGNVVILSITARMTTGTGFTLRVTAPQTGAILVT